MAVPSAFLDTHWFDLIQTIGIVVGLFFTGLSLRRDHTGRKLANLLALKEEHRELWNAVRENGELSRILKPDADLLARPMTSAEEVFLRQVIVHTAVSYELIRNGTPLDMEAFRNDVAEFFNLPLPREVWKTVRASQQKEFRTFLERASPSVKG